MIIAIDGPAGSGKSTVARAVARRLGFTYLDSGALYRAVALTVLRAGADPADAGAAGPLAAAASIELRAGAGPPLQVLLDGADVSEAIRSPEVSAASSLVAAHAPVRRALLPKQRALIERGDWVAEGRDIGTVVAPDAAVKVFLTADPDERARRRTHELQRRGVAAGAPGVREAIEERDRRDSTRAAAPLRPAADAVEVDTTRMTVDEVADRVVALAQGAGAVVRP